MSTTETRRQLADRLFKAAFQQCRDPRSEAYKRGVKDGLYFKMGVIATLTGKCPYFPGAAESDAWYSGLEEGKRLANAYLNAAERVIG